MPASVCFSAPTVAQQLGQSRALRPDCISIVPSLVVIYIYKTPAVWTFVDWRAACERTQQQIEDCKVPPSHIDLLGWKFHTVVFPNPAPLRAEATFPLQFSVERSLGGLH